MDIRPIRTDEDHTAALEAIDRLWGAPAGTPDGDVLDVLTVLVDAYENARWPVEALDPIDTIKAHMEATGRTQSDLATVIGSRSRASEIMARKRPLTIAMIRELIGQWSLPAGLLIVPYSLKKPAPPQRAPRGPGSGMRKRSKTSVR